MDINSEVESSMEVESMAECSIDVESDREEESEEDSENNETDKSDIKYKYSRQNNGLKLFDQQSLNDFIRRIGVAKDMAEYTDAELKDRGFVKKGTKSSYYR